MYQLTSEIYLDKRDKLYKKVVVISPPPQEKELQSITKLVNREKLSPFQERSNYCSQNQCFYGVLNPNKLCDFLCLDDLPILFNYLITSGFKINYDITKMLQDSNIKKQNLICYFNK